MTLSVSWLHCRDWGGWRVPSAKDNDLWAIHMFSKTWQYTWHLDLIGLYKPLMKENLDMNRSYVELVSFAHGCFAFIPNLCHLLEIDTSWKVTKLKELPTANMWVSHMSGRVALHKVTCPGLSMIVHWVSPLTSLFQFPTRKLQTLSFLPPPHPNLGYKSRH
jgi:hypothetical protein